MLDPLISYGAVACQREGEIISGLAAPRGAVLAISILIKEDKSAGMGQGCRMLLRASIINCDVRDRAS